MRLRRVVRLRGFMAWDAACRLTIPLRLRLRLAPLQTKKRVLKRSTPTLELYFLEAHVPPQHLILRALPFIIGGLFTPSRPSRNPSAKLNSYSTV